jgi:MerR family transcriptional regulator, light-induced transcriptional regulator
MDRLPDNSAMQETAALLRDLGVQRAQEAVEAPDPAPSAEERVARLVRTLELDIIPRLVNAHRDDAAPGSAGRRALSGTPIGAMARPPLQPASNLAGAQDSGHASSAYLAAQNASAPPSFDVPEFAKALLNAPDSEIVAQVDAWLASGVEVACLYDGLFASAARYLGQMWTDDRCNFSDVTIGCGRLHQQIRRLSPDFAAGVLPTADGRRILLIPAASEQHSLGLSMVSDHFRRDGWEVCTASPTTSHTGTAADAANRRVRDEWFDVIGVSLGSERNITATRQQIAALRRNSRNRAVGVLIGGSQVARDPRLGESVGADAVSADAGTATSVAELLLGSRYARAGAAVGADVTGRSARKGRVDGG